MSDAARQMMWIQNLMSEIGEQGRGYPLCADNQGGIFMALNSTNDKRTKHIDIRHHFIRDFLEEGHAKLYWIPTDQMIADGLTKNVGNQLHQKLIDMMGLST